MLSFSNQYNFVITSGGIGPTHDDRTFEGVAAAFGEKLYPHPDIVNVCKHFFGTDDLHNPKLKLAFVPESSKLLYGFDKITRKKLSFPLVVIKNVYIFPGVPHLMEKSFEAMEDVFRNPGGHVRTHELFVNQNEFSITDIIVEANEKFGSNVIIGSYPSFHNNYYKVALTMESENDQAVDDCRKYLENRLSSFVISNYDKNPMNRTVEKVYGLCADKDENFGRDISKSLEIVEKCFEDFNPNEVCVGFNGGKDCTALLHLVYAVMSKKLGQASNINCLYIRRGQTFPEVEKFIAKTVNRYQINLFTFEGSIKEALAEFKVVHPQVKAVVMGTRLTDPHCSHLREFHPTDPGWPEFMRVNPMLHWSYDRLWKFIRNLSLPYCSLYDVGYTSLGSMENTHPNPSLRRVDERGSVYYIEAYKLDDHGCERSGRN